MKTDTIGKRLKSWRKRKGLRLVDVAKQISVSQGSLSDLENDNSLPSCRTIQQLMAKTNISVHWLLLG